MAASIGGLEDQGLGMTDEGRWLIRQAIERNQLPPLKVHSLAESIDRRMAVYDREANGEPFRAYINVGGGAASVGRTIGKRRYQPGLNLTPPPGATEIDSVMTRFAERGCPLVVAAGP